MVGGIFLGSLSSEKEVVTITKYKTHVVHDQVRTTADLAGSCVRLIDTIQASLEPFSVVDRSTGEELDLMEAAERDIVDHDWEAVRTHIIRQRELIGTMSHAQIQVQAVRVQVDTLYKACKEGKP